MKIFKIIQSIFQRKYYTIRIVSIYQGNKVIEACYNSVNKKLLKRDLEDLKKIRPKGTEFFIRASLFV